MAADGDDKIVLGVDADAPLAAFGDESTAGNETSAAYAFVWFHQDNYARLSDRIRRAKKRSKIPDHMGVSEIPCSRRVGNHTDGRTKRSA